MPKSAKSPRNVQPLTAALIPDAHLTLKTAGAVCGVSLPTLYRRAKTDPTFPKLIKHGARCTRIRAGDLMAYLKAQGQQPQQGQNEGGV